MRLSEEQTNNLVKDYLNGVTWDNLCKKYDTNLCTIHKILKANNIQKSRVQNASWSKEKQELFKRMYLANCTYNEMYEALNCKGGTLTYWVHKLHLPMRGSGRNNIYPNKFAEHTIESDYWLGYIFADGHVGVYLKDKGVNTYTIQLASEKEYVVNKFKEWYDDIPHIYHRPYTLKDGTVKTMYKAEIGSKDIALWFKNELKIDNKKHHTLNPPIKINWDIIRGFFDGDGCSSKGQFVLNSCSKIWLERIGKFLDNFKIEYKLSKSYLDCWCLGVYKKEEVRKLVPLLYEHKYYCHQYKYDNFEPLISNNEVNIG